MSSVISTSTGFFEKLGWRSQRRPEPGFAHVLGAGAGAFIVFATASLITEVTSDDPTLPGILFSVALLVIGTVVGAQISGPVRTGAVTLIVFAVPLLWNYVLFSDGGSGEGDLRIFYAVTIVSYAVLYTVLWTKGRGILLGLVLLLLFSWIVWEIDNGNGALPFQGEVTSSESPLGGSGTPFIDGSADAGDNTSETGVAAMIIGLVYLGAAAALDRKKLAGAATPFIFAGLVATISGSVVLAVREDAIVGGLLLALAGLLVGLVGGWGTDRRFSTWIGVILIVIGLTIVSADVANSNLGLAGMFAAMALGLGGLAWYAAPRLNEYVDGNVDAGTTG
ncbi:MAG: hypothetical protein WD598_04730 [Acidimicrobiia bacterium]